MKNMDESAVKELVLNVQTGTIDAFDKLGELFSRWMTRLVKRIICKMANPDFRDLVSEAYSYLYEAALRYDEKRHNSVVRYLGNYVWDHLKLHAEQDRDGGFPGFGLTNSVKIKDNEENADALDVSADGIMRNFEATPEDQAVVGECMERLYCLQNNQTEQQKSRSVFLVVNDMLQNPHDPSPTSISRRTNIPKSTVQDSLVKIRKYLEGKHFNE